MKTRHASPLVAAGLSSMLCAACAPIGGAQPNLHANPSRDMPTGSTTRTAPQDGNALGNLGNPKFGGFDVGVHESNVSRFFEQLGQVAMGKKGKRWDDDMPPPRAPSTQERD